MMPKIRFGRPIHAWPDLDRRMAELAFAKGDILDGRGPGADLASATRRKRLHGYGIWLDFLARHSALDPLAMPSTRVTRELIAMFLAELRQRVSSRSVALYLCDLYVMLRLMEPALDLGWLGYLVSRLERAATPVRVVQPRLVPASQLFAAGMAAMAAVDSPDPGSSRRAGRYRDGLMVAMLAACPLRRRTFVGLSIGYHLQERAGAYILQLEPADLKNPAHLDFPLPAPLTPRLRRYLDRYRPQLLCGGRTDRLWINAQGTPISDMGIAERIETCTQREIGRPVSMHLFRHAAATSMAIEDPHHVNQIAALLGHARIGTSERHYNMATAMESASNYQRLLEALVARCRAGGGLLDGNSCDR